MGCFSEGYLVAFGMLALATCNYYPGVAVAGTVGLVSDETSHGRGCRQAAALPTPTNGGPDFETIDPAVAISLCRQAIAENPTDLASYAYLARALVKADRNQEAFDLLQPLRESGSEAVEAYLGVMYEYGYGTKQDDAEAAVWYRKAAEQGNATAEDNLGILYENARGVLQSYAEAASWYRKAADQGLSSAQNHLGNMYYQGHGVTQDYTEAASWFRKAADQGNVDAQSELAAMYYNGQGVPQDYTEAVHWYRRAGDQGNVRAQYLLGLLYGNGLNVPQDYAEAVLWYRKAADQGYADAEKELADMYVNGKGVAQDNTEAARWYRKAADQGNVDAGVNLGVLYANGRGMSKNEVEAVRLYRKAADQGNAVAQYNLAGMYSEGRGVTRDDSQALRWYSKAADQGNAPAQNALGIMYATGQGVPQDYTEAVQWYRRAADQDDVDGQGNLADAYGSGEGLPQDYIEALRWYRKAADQGSAHWQARLGRMYEHGHGVARDYAEALRWYRKGANQGDADAQSKLADLFKDGRGVQQDYAEAARWYRKAADQDDASAQYNLGTLYFSGRGVPQAYDEAVRWYIKAARGGDDASREIIGKAYLNADDPLHADLITTPGLQTALSEAAVDIGVSFEESKVDCFSYLVDCGEIAWRRLDLAKAANWYRMEAVSNPEAAFRLGRLLDAHPELAQSAGEALIHLHVAADAGNPEAGFILATRNLSAVPPGDRLGRVEAALASLSPETAIRLAFAGATGRFSDPVIAPAYLYLKTRADQGVAEAAVGLIYVYAFYGAYGEAEKVAGTLSNADWFELSGWDYSIDHFLDFWLEQTGRGNLPREGSLDGVQHLLSTLSDKGSQTAARLLSKLDGVKEAAAAHPATQAPASGPVMPALTAAEWQAAIDRIQTRIAEKQRLGGLSPLIVELYRALSRAQAALGKKEEAVESALVALSAGEQINAATRYQTGSLVYHLEQSCQLRKASEYLNGLEQNELSLLLAKAAVNDLQDARTELTGLPAGLQGCFRDQISDQYRVLADLFIRQGHFLEAEWVLGQLKDFETYEFNREERAYAGEALSHTPMTDEQNSVLAQIMSLPLQELVRLNQRSEDLDRDTDPTDAVRMEKTEVEDQLLKAKQDLDSQLAALKDNVTKLRPPDEATTLNAALMPGGVENLASTLRKLPANTAIFYTAVLPERIHILITTSAGTEHLVVPMPETQLNGMIGKARAELQDSTKDPIPTLQTLYDLLWKAADPDLRKLGITDVVLSLDRQLRYLPFDALHDGQFYLAERYRFNLLTAKENAQLGVRGGFPNLTVQAFGTSLGRSPNFEPLPNVPQEIDGIVKDPGVDRLGVLPGNRWLDGAFNRKNLAAALASKPHPPIVHIATHFAVGASDDTSRMLLGDGPMSLTDIKKIIATHLPAFQDIRLLVLSACETALGNGNELESMGAVMQDNGVESVIATLWPIADSSTAAFMVRFYTYLNLGVPRGEALQRTQIDFIHNRQDSPVATQPDAPPAIIASNAAELTPSSAPAHIFNNFSHPRYWAPFILMGQWK